jgi:tight adherence protein C
MISFFVVLAVLAAAYALFAPESKRPTAEQEQSGASPTPVKEQGIFDRWIRPAVKNLMPQMPTAVAEYAQKSEGVSALLARTGNPWRVTPEEYVVVRILSGLAGVLLLLFLTVVGYAPIPLYAALPLGLLLGYIAPKSILDSAWAKRRRDLNQILPEALDLLRICMNSGFNFPNALQQTVALLPESVTREELNRVGTELRAGRTVNQALSGFSRRCPTDPVEAFVRSISQAQATGIDIASTLAYQASETRNEYERIVEQRAQKLQTTLFLPLIGFFIPVLMALIFGPAVSTLMGALG